MALDPDDLTPAAHDFLRERHLATLSILRPDGTPHVTPVGVTYDRQARLARVITWSGSTKVRILERTGGGRVAVCQVDGARWLTLEGHATVTADPDRCAEAVARYAQRYRQPKDRGDDRRAIEIAVDRVMASGRALQGPAA